MKKIFYILSTMLCLHINAHLPQATILDFFNKEKNSNPKNLSSSLEMFSSASDESQIMWSILTPTLVERQKQFSKLYLNLLKQIQDYGLENKVELIFYRDNREADVGFKRNSLLAAAKGKYTCFLDDDDEVHPNYIKMIYDKLLEDKDCVKLIGILDWIGRWKKTFIHSIKYNSYFEKNNIYYRPPNHLNPIRRSIATQFKFPDKKNFGEDTDWAMQICNSGTIKTEASVNEAYYFYIYNPKKSVVLEKSIAEHRARCIKRNKAILAARLKDRT